MADTLTQEQIDAMLSSVLSGGDTASLDTHEEKEEIKEYDFRTPKKFTKEQIKILERIFENYSRHLFILHNRSVKAVLQGFACKHRGTEVF